MQLSAEQVASMLMADVAIPGWQEIVCSHEFLLWLARQPVSYQCQMHCNWDIEDLRACIAKFQQDTRGEE